MIYKFYTAQRLTFESLPISYWIMNQSQQSCKEKEISSLFPPHIQFCVTIFAFDQNDADIF